MIAMKVRGPARAPSESTSEFRKMLVAVLQASLIAAFGFYLTGRIELAVKERQANLSAATSMASLIAEMQDPHSEAEYKILARKIAMFGEDAIQPLTMMAAQGPYPEAIPVDALELVAIHHRKATCGGIERALRSGLVVPIRQEALCKLNEKLKCSVAPWGRPVHEKAPDQPKEKPQCSLEPWWRSLF